MLSYRHRLSTVVNKIVFVFLIRLKLQIIRAISKCSDFMTETRDR